MSEEQAAAESWEEVEAVFSSLPHVSVTSVFDRSLLKPPEEWLDDSSLDHALADADGCKASFEGSESTCKVYKDSRAPIAEDIVSSYATTMNLKGGDATDQEIATYGWAYLCHNLDLVKWVLCWLAGPDNDYYDCVKNRLNARWPFLVDIKLEDGEPAVIDGSDPDDPTHYGQVMASGTGGPVFFGGTIHVYSESGGWKNLRDGWSSTGPGVAYIQTCIASSLASIFLHELLHICGFVHAVEDYFGTCDFAVLVENCFYWALIQRYPSACGSSDNTLPGACCKPCSEEKWIWGNDEDNVFIWSSGCDLP